MEENPITKKTKNFFDRIEEEISYIAVKEKADGFRKALGNASNVANYRNWNLTKKQENKKKL